jgi:hypothetical protein
MVRVAPVRSKINTNQHNQPKAGQPSRRVGRGRSGHPAKAPARLSGDTRQPVRRCEERPVVELECGVTVDPSQGREMCGGRWVEEGLITIQAHRVGAVRVDHRPGHPGGGDPGHQVMRGAAAVEPRYAQRPLLGTPFD